MWAVISALKDGDAFEALCNADDPDETSAHIHVKCPAVRQLPTLAHQAIFTFAKRVVERADDLVRAKRGDAIQGPHFPSRPRPFPRGGRSVFHAPAGHGPGAGEWCFVRHAVGATARCLKEQAPQDEEMEFVFDHAGAS